MHLGTHAAGDRAREEVCEAIDDVREVAGLAGGNVHVVTAPDAHGCGGCGLGLRDLGACRLGFGGLLDEEKALLDEKPCNNVKHTRDQLQAVGAGDDLVVARVGTVLLGVHHVEPREREREDGAAQALAGEPEARARTPSSGVAAAALWDVALAADIVVEAVGRVLLEDGLTRPAGRAPKGGAQSRENAAARLLAAGVLEPQREDVRVILLG